MSKSDQGQADLMACRAYQREETDSALDHVGRLISLALAFDRGTRTDGLSRCDGKKSLFSDYGKAGKINTAAQSALIAVERMQEQLDAIKVAIERHNAAGAAILDLRAAARKRDNRQ